MTVEGTSFYVLPLHGTLHGQHGWTRVEHNEVPTSPWDLTDRRLIVRCDIADQADHANAVALLQRGAGLHLSTLWHGLSYFGLLEDLIRVGIPQSRGTGLLDLLGHDHLAILEHLSTGARPADIAGQLGWSLRTLHRRIHALHQALEVPSTAAAIADYHTWRLANLAANQG